jgi:hypothetical protein
MRFSDASNYPVPSSENAIRTSFLELAHYARFLEDQLAKSKPAKKSPQDLSAAVGMLKSAAVSGIKKQMSVRSLLPHGLVLSSTYFYVCTQWKPSCKTASAKWAYDGVCSDPIVFGMLLGLDGPPTFKTKKYTVDEFKNLVGGIQASVR